MFERTLFFSLSVNCPRYCFDKILVTSDLNAIFLPTYLYMCAFTTATTSKIPYALVYRCVPNVCYSVFILHKAIDIFCFLLYEIFVDLLRCITYIIVIEMFMLY